MHQGDVSFLRQVTQAAGTAALRPVLQMVLLLPSFKAIQAHSKATGGEFSVGDKTPWKHLRAEGIIESSDTRARNTVQLRFNCFGGKNVDVLKIDRKHFGIAE